MGTYMYVYMSRCNKSEATVFIFFRFEAPTSQKLPVYFRKLLGVQENERRNISYFCYFQLLVIFELLSGPGDPWPDFVSFIVIPPQETGDRQRLAKK